MVSVRIGKASYRGDEQWRGARPMSKMETTSAQSTGSQLSVTGNSAPEPEAPRSQQAGATNFRVWVARKTREARARKRIACKDASLSPIVNFLDGKLAVLADLRRMLHASKIKRRPAGNTQEHQR